MGEIVEAPERHVLPADLVEDQVELPAPMPAGSIHQLESLCMRCGEQGITRLLLTKIPHFREVVVMAFDCPHCGEKNNEVQFAGAIAPQGCKITLSVPAGDRASLDRQVVKSETATIRIPMLDFEIPPEAQRGSLSTVEGVLMRAHTELSALQDERRKADADVAEKLDKFLEQLLECAGARVAFTMELDDPAGNSFIQSPRDPENDKQLKVEQYTRTAEQTEKLGFLPAPAAEGAGSDTLGPQQEPTVALTTESSHPRGYVPAGTTRVPHGAIGAAAAHRAIAMQCSPQQAESLLSYSAPEEVMMFPAHCSACGAPSETRMYVTNIPYFKEVILMSTACDSCGFRSSELKAGGSTSEKGKRICLLVKSPADLTRDVIKSDTASVAIPEVDIELSPGTLGGRVTTVEGLVTDIEESLGRVRAFEVGDSAPEWKRSKWQEVRAKLKGLLDIKQEWHLILDDALANSFVAPIADTCNHDPQLAVEEYTRTWEQDEELGLHDMETGEGSAPEEVNSAMEQID